MSSEAAPEPADRIAVALRHARRFLSEDPALALATARDILEIAPGHVEARFMVGAALRRTDDLDGARRILEPFANAHDTFWGAQYELGVCLAALGETRLAIEHLRKAAALNPRSSLAWHALGDELSIAGDAVGAEDAHGRQTPGAIGDPAFIDVARAVLREHDALALSRLRDQFNLHLGDLAAVGMVADAGLRLGLAEEVEDFLVGRLARAPRFLALRHRFALALHGQGKLFAAMAEVDQLLVQAPDSAPLLGLRAALLVESGDYDAALTIFDRLVSASPVLPHVWLAYGHALKTVGRQADSVAAYRRSLALRPDLGEAYWSLANLKVVAFEPQDLRTMQDLLARPDLRAADRVSLYYALGKGLEDAGDFDASFAAYQAGAVLRRAEAPHDAKAHHDYIEQVIATFTSDFFAARQGQGSASPDPIFVVGLPRSGSTLVEQMLASHSAVEGVSELPDLTTLARRLARSLAGAGADYPGSIAGLDASELRAAGEAYLAGAQGRRKLGRPFFVDKFPGNVLHVGLIHLILPQAKIVDVRRHPLACCFSGFKQHFAQGQNYSYDLADIGAYYADYVALTAHFDAVLPGRIHRVQYENLIENPESEVRRLLDYCGLDYEAACLDFHQYKRPVRTASSEQVRRPIFNHGVEHWRKFELWLAPLKAALTGVD